jgi:hypothetical protein
LIALHHLFSFSGLKDECRSRMKSSGSDDAIVSEKMAKINMNAEFGMRKGETMIKEAKMYAAERAVN